MKANIPLRNFSDYFFENISVGYSNQLQITSTCNAKCIFCSNEQNPFDIRRCSFRSLDEIEKVVWATNEINGSIRLNESLPGRISEGEAFLHPDFFTILQVIRQKFNNCIRITTNASLLRPDFIKQLKNFLPIEVNVSIPTINKEHWKESFNLNDENYYNAINSFSIMAGYDFRVTSNITPMPSWIGWNELEDTFKFLSQNSQYTTIYAPGYTRNSKIIDKLKYDKIELSLFLENMSKKYSFAYDWSLDPRKALYISYDLITNNIWKAYNNGSRNFLWLTSTSAKERFDKLIFELCLGIPINNTVIEVPNNSYGGNIECVGLWMIQDIDDVLKSLDFKPDQIFIPGGFLDKYGFDLQGDNILDLFKKHSSLYIGIL